MRALELGASLRAPGQLNSGSLRQRLGACHREEVDPVLLEFRQWLPHEPQEARTVARPTTHASRRVPYSVLMQTSLSRPNSSPSVARFLDSVQDQPEKTYPPSGYDRPWRHGRRQKEGSRSSVRADIAQELEAMRPEALLRKRLELSDEYQVSMQEFLEKEGKSHEARMKILYDGSEGSLMLEHLRSKYNDSSWRLFLKTSPMAALKPGQELKDLKTMNKTIRDSCTRMAAAQKEPEEGGLRDALASKGR